MNAGFSTAPAEKLYIRQDPSKDRPTAADQMADVNSLYHEIKRLIALRQAHSALQSKGEIEFIYAEKNAYPLAYIRTSSEEKIMIIINPAAREVSFDSAYTIKEIIYQYCGQASNVDGKIVVPAQSVTFAYI